MKKSLMIALTGLIVGAQVLAQDSRITVEITKEIDGEKKTFRGAYENEEQMMADPNYQEFAQSENSFDFSFDHFGGNDVFGQFHSFFDEGGFFNFNFDDANNSYHFFSDSSLNQIKDWDMDEFREHMKNLGIDIDEFTRRLDKDPQPNFYAFSTGGIQVEDVEPGEFGKKGVVKDANKLILEDLSFHPSSLGSDQLKVKFSVPEEGELGLSVYNQAGKEIFSRYFTRFGGYYSETIDLSNQEEGTYLLEIKRGSKRLTKKIIIE